MGRKLLFTVLLIVAALLMFELSSRSLPFIDSYTDRYFTETTSEAALAYATVRGVNAVVSVLKESQVELSPAGIGVNIAAGQILDPIDDMTERLSSVLVTALVSLGLQKLILEISRLVPLKFLALVLFFLAGAIWLGRRGRNMVIPLILNLCGLLLISRFFLPASSFISDSLYQHLLKDEISAAESKLSHISEGYRDLNRITEGDESDHLFSMSKSAKQKINHIKRLFALISDNVDQIIVTLLQLTVLYVSLFILQVIAIPVLMFWGMVQLVNRFLRLPFIPFSDIRIPGSGVRTSQRSQVPADG